MLNDTEVDQLVADVKQMGKELRLLSESCKDAAQRKRAARWLSTLRRTVNYAVQCRGNARSQQRAL